MFRVSRHSLSELRMLDRCAIAPSELEVLLSGGIGHAQQPLGRTARHRSHPLNYVSGTTFTKNPWKLTVLTLASS